MKNYHITFSTKYRKQLISSEIEKEICSCCEAKANEFGTRILAINTAGDHVHLLLGVSDDVDDSAVVKIIGAMKGSSSYYVRKQHPELRSLPALWAGGYYISECVDTEHINNTINYIARQKEHHGISVG